MSTVSQKRRTNKKPAKRAPKPGTTPTDRSLLKHAAKEQAEGRPGLPMVSIPACEVRSICAQLKELTHVAVDAWATRDGFADGLEHVLVKLHAVRRNLESATEPSAFAAGNVPP